MLSEDNRVLSPQTATELTVTKINDVSGGIHPVTVCLFGPETAKTVTLANPNLILRGRASNYARPPQLERKEEVIR